MMAFERVFKGLKNGWWEIYNLKLGYIFTLLFVFIFCHQIFYICLFLSIPCKILLKFTRAALQENGSLDFCDWQRLSPACTILYAVLPNEECVVGRQSIQCKKRLVSWLVFFLHCMDVQAPLNVNRPIVSQGPFSQDIHFSHKNVLLSTNKGTQKEILVFHSWWCF